MGVRNMYCSTCEYSERKHTPKTDHKCSKNWQGSSTAMEADIIVDGFVQSVPLHDWRWGQQCVQKNT